MNSEENHDSVWSLLGASKATAVRPNFSADVLSAISHEPQDRPLAEHSGAKVLVFPQRTWMRWVGLTAAAAALVAGAFFALHQPAAPTMVQAQSDAPTPVAAPPSVNEAEVEDTLEQELVAVDGISSLIEVQEVSQLNDAELLALLN